MENDSIMMDEKQLAAKELEVQTLLNAMQSHLEAAATSMRRSCTVGKQINSLTAVEIARQALAGLESSLDEIRKHQRSYYFGNKE